MNGKLVCVLAILCAVMLADTDALRLRIRGRRIWNRIKKPVCRAACTYTCTAVTSGSAAPVCGLGCREVCNRKKRTANLLDEVKDNQVVIPLPRDFGVYDIDNNGTIELTELAEVLSLEASRSDVIKAFSVADVDDDGHISEVELEEAPWFFEEDEDANSEDLVDTGADDKDLKED